jgi:hypothetical protein
LDNRADEPEGRPRLLFLVVFLAFFLGFQTLMDSLALARLIVLPDQTAKLEQLYSNPVFTRTQIHLLIGYQIFFGASVLLTAYLLLSRMDPRARKFLKGIFAIDVFLFIAVALRYAQFDYRPPSAEKFYYDVFCTLLEVFLIICLSHPSLQNIPGPEPEDDLPKNDS